MSENLPTKRFSKTVENYIRYRPSYPVQVLQLLEENCELTPDKIIADIGCGTGIFTKLFVEAGYQVIGIEPNENMLNAAREQFGDYAHFKAKLSPAENTGLADQSVDFITMAQAFHWVDAEKAKKEFQRISKPNGTCLLVWNLRVNETPVMKAYEDLLLRFGTDYQKVAAENIVEEDIRAFFAPNELQIVRFYHSQTFDYDGFKGRLLSTSYSPKQGDTGFEDMIGELTRVFEACQKDGFIEFEYECKCYYGSLV